MTDVAKVYPVAEIFGPTIEGEGDLIGAVCYFVRFAGCDSACVWCDSGHAVLAENVRKARKVTAPEILAELSKLRGNPSWVVFSGGNPCLHQGLDWLIDRLNFQQISVNVETQGTRFKPWLNRVQLVTCSPKPPSSGNTMWPDQLAVFLNKVTSRTILKVVVFDERDLEYAAEIHHAFPRLPFYISCGSFAGGLHSSEPRENLSELAGRYRGLAEMVSADARFGDARVLPQLHVIAWGHAQGH